MVGNHLLTTHPIPIPTLCSPTLAIAFLANSTKVPTPLFIKVFENRLTNLSFPPELKAAKLATLPTFTEAISFYLDNNYATAEHFAVCIQACPNDTVVQIYVEGCAENR
jgi:hypothetical protein